MLVLELIKYFAQNYIQTMKQLTNTQKYNIHKGIVLFLVIIWLSFIVFYVRHRIITNISINSIEHYKDTVSIGELKNIIENKK